MKIENITIGYFCTNGFDHIPNEGTRHIKELPYLSVVQATEGHYAFGLNGGEQREVPCGDCFIAPALARQEITHHMDPASGCMSARWVFMEVFVNDTIPFDLAFTLPPFPDKLLCRRIGVVFDRIFTAEQVIDRKIGCHELLKLLLPHAEEISRRDPQIEEAVHYIRDHFKERLTVEEIASVTGMSPPNLYRRFKAAMGTSPMEYCISLRLSHACILLTQSTYSIETIAGICGMGDPFYFSKMFKKKFGVPPMVYRKH